MENQEILKNRMRRYNKRSGARVGDYIVLKNGRVTRFTYEWPEGLQIGSRKGGGDCGSFYLGDGYLSYSGSLDPSISFKKIKPAEKRRKGRVWFFDGNFWGAGRGVEFYPEFRVFKEK